MGGALFLLTISKAREVWCYLPWVTALSLAGKCSRLAFPSVIMCINTLKMQTEMSSEHWELLPLLPLTFSSCSSNTASWTLQAKSEVGKSLKSIISSKSSSFSPKIICSSSSWSLLYRSDWLSVQDFMESLSILPPQQLLPSFQLPAGPCQPKTQKWGDHIFITSSCSHCWRQITAHTTAINRGFVLSPTNQQDGGRALLFLQEQDKITPWRNCNSSSLCSDRNPKWQHCSRSFSPWHTLQWATISCLIIKIISWLIRAVLWYLKK